MEGEGEMARCRSLGKSFVQREGLMEGTAGMGGLSSSERCLISGRWIIFTG